MAGLKAEIAQRLPFSSIEEEALLSLLRTSDCLQRAFQRRTRDWGITSTQYNVLRILRGAQPRGLTCSAIGGRMITAEPDITRLLKRLKTLNFIRQQRDRQDRRVVWTRISASIPVTFSVATYARFSGVGTPIIELIFSSSSFGTISEIICSTWPTSFSR